MWLVVDKKKTTVHLETFLRGSNNNSSYETGKQFQLEKRLYLTVHTETSTIWSALRWRGIAF